MKRGKKERENRKMNEREPQNKKEKIMYKTGRHEK
jgi:hypothetical protein